MNEYAAVVLPFDAAASHWRLRIGAGRLACRSVPGIKAGTKIRVRVRPADVLVAAEEPKPISARNVLPCRVTSVKTVAEGVYVGLDAGFELFALVTRQAVGELGIRKGSKLFAIIKANAVEVLEDVKVPFRVVAQGPRGDIGVQQIDLLRAIDIAGSLTEAAKRLGVTYRTAWMWAEAINAAWNKPLLQTTHGGKGGGGASLTPAGRALLEAVAEVEGGNGPWRNS